MRLPLIFYYLENVCFLYSPGKLAFFKKLIATEFFLPQCIFIRSPDQHTKSPKESSHGKYANLHKSNMAANKLEMAISL